jgi:hypothetical protein
MSRRARWIRLGFPGLRELRAAAAAFSGLQGRDAPPAVFWSRIGSAERIPGAGGEPRYAFAVMAPAQCVPGRATRWTSWALTPAVAALRDLGLRAYLDGSTICIRGRRLATGQAERVADSVVITTGLELEGQGGILSATPPGVPEFRAWLREGLGLAATQWDPATDIPTERAFETELRVRIEAQHGWQFENAWPDAREQAAIREAQEPLAARGRDGDPERRARSRLRASLADT